MSEEDFEVREPEDYFGTKRGESFSFSQIVMSAMRKVIENGSKEMKEGYWNTKFDRLGNAHKVWIPDSRNEFIESVLSLKIILEREFDTEIIEKIRKIEEELKEKYDDLLIKDKEEWLRTNFNIKNNLFNKGYYHREGYLSKCFPYFSEYIEEKIMVYRKITSELLKLIKRNGDFQEEIYEA